MRTNFTVCDDSDAKWVRVREDVVYQERFNELFYWLSLMYGGSKLITIALAWDYFVLSTSLVRLLFITCYDNWNKESRLESRIRYQSGSLVCHQNV